MGQNGNIILLLEICRDVDSVFTRAAACTVCNAHKVRTQCRNFLRCVCDRLIAAAGLGREYLKRKGYFILIQKLRNLHIASPMFLLVFLFNKRHDFDPSENSIRSKAVVFIISHFPTLFPDKNTI